MIDLLLGEAAPPPPPNSVSRRSCIFCAMSLRPTWWCGNSVFTHLRANPTLTLALKWSGLSILETLKHTVAAMVLMRNYPKLEQKRPETLRLSKHIFAEGFSRSSSFFSSLEPLENTHTLLLLLFLVAPLRRGLPGRTGRLRDVFSRTPLCSYLSHVWFFFFSVAPA